MFPHPALRRRSALLRATRNAAGRVPGTKSRPNRVRGSAERRVARSPTPTARCPPRPSGREAGRGRFGLGRRAVGAGRLVRGDRWNRPRRTDRGKRGPQHRLLGQAAAQAGVVAAGRAGHAHAAPLRRAVELAVAAQMGRLFRRRCVHRTVARAEVARGANARGDRRHEQGRGGRHRHQRMQRSPRLREQEHRRELSAVARARSRPRPPPRALQPARSVYQYAQAMSTA